MSRIPTYMIASKEINGRKYIQYDMYMEHIDKLSGELDEKDSEIKCLKVRIDEFEQKMSEKETHEELPFADEAYEDGLLAEYEDRHQSDCIRINELRTAYLVTLDELAKLREQMGLR